MGDDADPSLYKSGVELEIRPHPLAVPTFLYSPWISIDGMLPTKFGWGKHFVPLSVGSHSLLRIGKTERRPHRNACPEGWCCVSHMAWSSGGRNGRRVDDSGLAHNAGTKLLLGNHLATRI
jgi:hypothetical protein